MSIFITREDYIKGFTQVFTETKRNTKDLEVYVTTQVQRLDTLLEDITQKNFWQRWPAILGIDAKLSLVTELVHFEDFSSEEIIRMAETDYQTYFKELCGYDLSMETKHSMIFNVQ
ncbi:DUF7006 family protein [Enterococcus sp. DIV1297f]|uniref:DUF7006 family protein n=1 Tax=Enterococcus sp. DIV1297f TaxID=2774691 RepID=UPI003D277AD5